MKIYLASPLGFSELGRLGLKVLKDKLISLGHSVYDPWEDCPPALIGTVIRPEKTYAQVLRDCEVLAYDLGRQNRQGIDLADCVFAVLDGQELDSGTVSELAYMVGKGKRAYGYRGDFRNVDGMPSIPFNLQVWYFILSSGGRMFYSVDEICL